MTRRRRAIGRTPRRSRGYAIAILLVIVTLGALTALVNQLNAASSQGLFRDKQVLEQIRTAKLALIEYSANHRDRPGGLPCPDRNGDGDEEVACATEAEQIGRLPWRTLKLAQPQPADGGLWYALSSMFQIQGKETAPAAVWAINSNTVGDLDLRELVGNAQREKKEAVVALIIHPGPALGFQARSGSLDTPSTITQYLEGANANVADARTFAIAEPTPVFNDTVVAVTHDELFDVVEAVVEERIRRTVVSAIDRHHKPTGPGTIRNSRDETSTSGNSYGSYPIPRPFANPTLAIPVPPPGIDITVAGTLPEGLLPVAAIATGWVRWDTVVAPTAVCVLPIATCNISCPVPAPDVPFECTIQNTGSGMSNFEVVAPLAEGARAFLKPLQYRAGGYSAGSDIDGWDESLLAHPFDVGARSPKITHWQESNGRAMIKIEGRVIAGVATTKFRVRRPAFDPDITEAIPPIAPPGNDWTTRETAWFMRNRWYENVFYAVSRQSIAGTSGFCFVMLPGITAPNEECLRVLFTKLTGNANPFNRAEVALILMGRPIRQSPGLAFQSRAAGAAGDNIANYLELENLTSNRLFEHRAERFDINDRVIYIERQP